MFKLNILYRRTVNGTRRLEILGHGHHNVSWLVRITRVALLQVLTMSLIEWAALENYERLFFPSKVQMLQSNYGVTYPTNFRRTSKTDFGETNMLLTVFAISVRFWFYPESYCSKYRSYLLRTS